jgi:hypothetical protein
MATRILGPTGSRRRRRFLFVPVLVVALVAFFVIAGAQANPPEQSGNFELDKNVINDESTTFLGQLGGNINATVTSFTVCQAISTNPGPLPITIQIDAEQMTVGAIAAAGGGGCSGAFKRTYSSVTRGVNLTTAASHGASGVSGRVTQIVTGSVPGDDWDQVFAAVAANGHPSEDNPNPCSGAAWTGSSAITACDHVNDPDGDSIFIGGGSKDDLDINEGTPPNLTPNWEHTDGSVPDADDITNGYAAKYDDPDDGHEYLFFGADRVAVNGAKDMGFWFFKSPVSLNDDGTFSGQHTVGDILLLGTFTQGGAASNIRVFSWVGENGDTNDVLESGGAFEDCIPGGQDGGCNTVNNSTIQSPWAYQSKISGSPADTMYAGAMMEGGVDLTTLELEGCFSNFLVETRSSPEIGAQLKDFILGQFEVCESALTTTPADGAGEALTDTNDNDIPDIEIGTGAAGVDVTDQANLTVEGTDTWSGTLHFFICGPIPTGVCDEGGLEIGTGTPVDQDDTMPVVSGSANLTSVGRYCWRGEFDSDTPFVDDQTDASEGECFEVLPVTPALVTQAGADVTLGNPITDSSTLIGTAHQPGDDGPNATYPSINATMDTPANGTITFTLFGPDNCTDVPTGFTPIEVTVSGDRTTHPGYMASFTPTQVGEFTWVATYSGDSPNTNGAGPTACPEEAEEVVVTGTSQSSTTQNWLPNDSATITGDTNLNGTLTFQLYTGDNCGVTSGAAVAGQFYSFTFTNEPSPATRTTTNGNDPANTFRVTATNEGSYSWLVHYNDTTLTDPTDKCEKTTIDITD